MEAACITYYIITMISNDKKIKPLWFEPYKQQKHHPILKQCWHDQALPGQVSETASMAFYRAHGPFKWTLSLPSFRTEECFITAAISEPRVHHMGSGRTSVEKGKGSEAVKQHRHLARSGSAPGTSGTNPPEAWTQTWLCWVSMHRAVFSVVRTSLNQPKAEQSLSYAPGIYTDFLKIESVESYYVINLRRQEAFLRAV